jgi:hypothetical protein
LIAAAAATPVIDGALMPLRLRKDEVWEGLQSQKSDPLQHYAPERSKNKPKLTEEEFMPCYNKDY